MDNSALIQSQIIQLKISSVLSVYEEGCWLGRLTSCAASAFQMSHQPLVLKYYGALHRAGFLARPAHQSLGKPIRVFLTSRPYKSSRANMSPLPPCPLHPLITQAHANWGIYDIQYSTYCTDGIKQRMWIHLKNAASLPFALIFFSSSHLHLCHLPPPQNRGRRGGPAPPFGSASHKSAHRCCRGWWSALSPSPPRWSNWKRTVPPQWTHGQGAASVRQTTGYEQLINNYGSYGLPQGQGYNLEQEEDVKRVCSLNYRWSGYITVHFLSVISLFCLSDQQRGGFCIECVFLTFLQWNQLSLGVPLLLCHGGYCC